MKKVVNVIGAGLSGCEAAYQLAKRGYKVNLFEVKKIKKNEVQKLDSFAELVCSNTFRSSLDTNAVGTLKKEMEMFDSLILKCAKKSSIPAGQSLAVDREIFSQLVTKEIKTNSNITVIDKEVTTINPDEVTIIASGPLTTESLKSQILKLVGEKYFYFFDAIAPTIDKESINFDIAFIKNRYEKGDTEDYLNCPMNKEEYLKFYNELINAKTVELKLTGEKTFKVFEGCMPIEVMAKRGEDTMRFGPLKPVGLRNLDGSDNYAVVQLRIDNAAQNAYNMVGFQTNLLFEEQKRVFRLIPGLENANFLKYGQMHENSYINSPTVLDYSLQLKSNKNIFFAGQITGVEGYVESTSTGIVCALNVISFIEGNEKIVLPKHSVMGGLINYIITTDSLNFQPSKANWAIANIQIDSTKKIKKVDKYKIYSDIALKNMQDFIKLINKEKKLCI